MTIVDFSEQCNPEQISQHLTSLVDDLKANVQTAAEVGESFDYVERIAHKRKTVYGVVPLKDSCSSELLQSPATSAKCKLTIANVRGFLQEGDF